MTKLGIDAVSNLTEGFKTGGVMGMIEAAGQMANAFAENLPSIIEQGLPLVEGFTENLRSNAGKLVDGGIDLMLKLAQGLMDGRHRCYSMSRRLSLISPESSTTMLRNC